MTHLRKRKENVEKGGVNCIPSPIPDLFVGVQQRKYYVITGAQKSAKTQFTSYVFIYNSVLYAYNNPKKVRVKFFYVPLEETPETVMMRFMCFLLFYLSGRKIRICIEDLESTDSNKPLSAEILSLLESEEYRRIFEFFESCIEFVDSSNPTGLYKRMSGYAEEHGKRIYKEVQTINKATGEPEIVKRFDHYEPNDPDEYVMMVVDHISIMSTESGMDLRNTIIKFDSYMVELRNKYGYIPVVIQQQSAESQGLEAFKLQRIKASVSGLGDGKTTARNCDFMFGITNPYSYALPNYLDYNIKLLKDNQRFVEVLLNRGGRMNLTKAFYFDGAVSFFFPLPSPKSPDYAPFMEKVYALIEKLNPEEKKSVSLLALLKQKI